MTGSPSFTAVIAAYQSERWIAAAVDSVLAQTRAAAQIIVVDDGSTDGTAAVLERYGDAIEVIRRPNGGCPAAFNTAFSRATGDYVALCGSDDIWEPDKLERQAEAVIAHPDVDLLFGDARLFGLADGTYALPPGTGVLDARRLRSALYRLNFVCAPTVAIRRELFERLGGFVERFGADDYEYWMRCLRAGATFYFDPAVLVRYRRHEGNLSSNLSWMQRCLYDVHRWYADDIEDPALVHGVLASDLFRIGRFLVDEHRYAEARGAFRASLGHGRGARAVIWALLLGLPPGVHVHAARGLVRVKRLVQRQRQTSARAPLVAAAEPDAAPADDPPLPAKVPA
jgi:glycosyltransferase involved in cell wall biosynthesis